MLFVSVPSCISIVIQRIGIWELVSFNKVHPSPFSSLLAFLRLLVLLMPPLLSHSPKNTLYCSRFIVTPVNPFNTLSWHLPGCSKCQDRQNPQAALRWPALFLFSFSHSPFTQSLPEAFLQRKQQKLKLPHQQSFQEAQMRTRWQGKSR